MFIVQTKGGRIVSRIVFSFYLVKNQKIATNSTTTEDKEKISTDLYSFVKQLLLIPLPKFGSKVWKIFLTQPFSICWILYCFVSFTNKIFCSAQILLLSMLYVGLHLETIKFWIIKLATNFWWQPDETFPFCFFSYMSFDWML